MLQARRVLVLEQRGGWEAQHEEECIYVQITPSYASGYSGDIENHSGMCMSYSSELMALTRRSGLQRDSSVVMVTS